MSGDEDSNGQSEESEEAEQYEEDRGEEAEESGFEEDHPAIACDPA